MKTAVLICPGRGTYNKEELGVLGRRFPDAALLAAFDMARRAGGQASLTELDAADRFLSALHLRGDNASGLIYAASLGDALSIDRDEIEVVAVTGNSMGWYTALACGGAVDAETGFEIVNTMGRWMHEDGAGGQTLYPFAGDDWRDGDGHRARLLDLVAEIGARPDHALSLSINLGGLLVLAGNEAGLAAFEAAVPKRDRFPLRLPGHAGFHSGLVADVSARALSHFGASLFRQPDIPMIDGRGAIWWPGAARPEALRDYTFGHQVVQPYDFTRAVTVAAREFAPDLFIVTGPGTTLGGAVAQSLVQAEWRGMATKDDFQAAQTAAPLLISMGRDDQRQRVTKG
ncbi:ACP S-malonyltransferase [Alphaproteobacteria bacterium GH1-50]|uniref:[acyl-carrier-protein] S-malonyltransferase n=1 Tax=Kangsaoukella pontilimi TaxID=2691042 RepID=A0A7C9MQG1_9RHOB|nr:ACP S-malonyltransferase [Kangsaoukella pontilimi]MXQ07377.1 ACP S-malonyltransferase [Kangsaoukella pontilimi]